MGNKHNVSGRSSVPSPLQWLTVRMPNTTVRGRSPESWTPSGNGCCTSQTSVLSENVWSKMTALFASTSGCHALLLCCTRAAAGGDTSRSVALLTRTRSRVLPMLLTPGSPSGAASAIGRAGSAAVNRKRTCPSAGSGHSSTCTAHIALPATSWAGGLA